MSTQLQQSKKPLNDVYVMRPLAMVILVACHAFMIYMGDWREPVGFHSNEVYWWLAKFFRSIVLELFVFVSGYVFGLTLERKNPTFKNLIISKVKRLIIPSLVFSAIYFFCFYDLENFTVVGFLWKILNGCGHMWFLPMLFWVTLIAFIIDKIKLPQWLKLVGVYCLPVLWLLGIPLGVSQAMWYIPFFYTGIIIYRNRDKFTYNYNKSLIVIALLGIVYIITFIFTTIIRRDVISMYIDGEHLVLKGLAFLCDKYFHLLCAAIVVAFVYGLINYLLKVKGMKISQWVLGLNDISMGVYIFHQFILIGLYYHTDIPIIVGSIWLPWAGTAIALTGSLLLSWLFRKTKLGRALI